MRIDRCLCYRRTFAELKEVAAQTGAASVRELQGYVKFGLNCRLCHPYIREMLRTGRTTFDEIIPDDGTPSILKDE